MPYLAAADWISRSQRPEADEAFPSEVDAASATAPTSTASAIIGFRIPNAPIAFISARLLSGIALPARLSLPALILIGRRLLLSLEA